MVALVANSTAVHRHFLILQHTTTMPHKFFFVACLFAIQVVIVAQNTTIDYHETYERPAKKIANDTTYFFTHFGVNQSFGMNFKPLAAALSAQNIRINPINGAPLLLNVGGYFQRKKLLVGSNSDVFTVLSDFSPGKAALTFTSSTLTIGYQVFSNAKWQILPFVGLSIQTTEMDIEIQSPPVNFNTALNTATKTTLLHVNFGAQVGVMAMRQITRYFYIGAQAGYAGSFADAGWFYNSTQLSDGPKISTNRGYIGANVGIKMR